MIAVTDRDETTVGIKTTDGGTFGRGIGISALPQIDGGESSATKPTIAILSLGEMGLGLATLLSKFKYPVVTNLDGRSIRTQARAKAAGVSDLPMTEILEVASIVLSIVPPGEALGLAQEIAQALLLSRRSTTTGPTYLDLNAISPDLVRRVGQVVTWAGMTFLDGAIIGFPPKELEDKTWFRPAITISGTRPDAMAGPWTEQLSSILNFRHVGNEIGAASGLKMCFGAIYKGHAAVAIQAYMTAHNLGVLPALQGHLDEYFPTVKPIIESAIFGSQRKAYRWIKEMEEVEATFMNEGGWNRELFAGVSDVFRIVSQQTSLEVDNKDTVQDITEKICHGMRREMS